MGFALLFQILQFFLGNSANLLPNLQLTFHFLFLMMSVLLIVLYYFIHLFLLYLCRWSLPHLDISINRHLASVRCIGLPPDTEQFFLPLLLQLQHSGRLILLVQAPISTFSNWRQYDLLCHFYYMISIPNLCV